MAEKDLSAQRVRELLVYDRIAGEFRWAISDRNRKAGNVTGYPCKSRRGVMLSIDGASYRAHRVAWLYVTGSLPRGVVDHINGDWRDNRFCNLRDVDQKTNMENQRNASSRSRSGLLGVQKNGPNQWCSLIQVDRVRHYLGNYYSAEEAHQAYLEAKRRLHEGGTI